MQICLPVYPSELIGVQHYRNFFLSSSYWFFWFITHGPGWVKCSSSGFSSIDVYLVNPWFYLSVSCLPQPDQEPHSGRLSFDQFVSSLSSLVTGTQMISNGCLGDECMNNWMKGNEFWILHSIILQLISFSLSLFSESHLPIFSLIFLCFVHHSQLSIFKVIQRLPSLAKGSLISLHRKMKCVGDGSINVSAGQGNHARDVIFYREPSVVPLSKAGVL